MPDGDLATSPVLDAYLARLEAALQGIPADDRADLVLEIRSHVIEQTRRSPMLSVPEVLAGLGDPETYAQALLGDKRGAPDASRDGGGALGALAALSGGRWRTAPALLLVICAYSVIGAFLLVALCELVDPANTGVYFKPWPNGHLYFLLSGAGHPPPDALGAALIPLMLALAWGIHVLVRQFLRRHRSAMKAA